MKVWRLEPTPTGSATSIPRARSSPTAASEIADPHGEVLAEVAGHRRLDQMDLLAAHVDPGAGDAQVGSIVTKPAPQHLGVEGDALVDVGHVEGDMVDGQRLHGQILLMLSSGGSMRVPTGSRVSTAAAPTLCTQ